jgi:predicted restriction endonuclease
MKGYDWNKRTIKDARSLVAFHARIRQMARRLFDRSGKPKRCAVCGYDKHVEICHIKGIQDFDENDTISAVNNMNNLIALCANCHWELDNGLLKLE